MHGETPQQLLYNKIWNLQKQHTTKLLKELNENDVKAILFKGAERIINSFNNQAINYLFDVDILIPKNELVVAMEILYSYGYKPGIFNSKSKNHEPRDIQEIASIEHSHYQLPPFSKIEKLELSSIESDLAKKTSKRSIMEF